MSRPEKTSEVRAGGGGSGAAGASPRLVGGRRGRSPREKKPKFKLYGKNYAYAPLHGVNVIARVREEDTDFWSSVHASIGDSGVAPKYFLPLPSESYHVTTNNLFTENDEITHDDFAGFIDENLVKFQKLHKLLESEGFKFVPIVIVDHIEVQKSITLSVRLVEEQLEIIRAVCRRMISVGGDFMLGEKGCLLSLIPKKFHITLAYRYREVASEDLPAMEQLRKHILKLMMKKKIKLQPPALCYFSSMEEFLSWDAKKNPFVLRAGCTIS